MMPHSSKQEIEVFSAQKFRILCDIVLKALFLSGLKPSSKNFDVMEFRKRLWLLYLLVTGLEIALTMSVEYVQNQSAKNNQIGVELLYASKALYKLLAVGLPLRALAYKRKNLHEFFY